MEWNHQGVHVEEIGHLDGQGGDDEGVHGGACVGVGAGVEGEGGMGIHICCVGSLWHPPVSGEGSVVLLQSVRHRQRRKCGPTSAEMELERCLLFLFLLVVFLLCWKAGSSELEQLSDPLQSSL